MNLENTYAGVDPSFGAIDHAKYLLRSIPYDGTSTWGKGADLGYAAFMDASANMELYDIETQTEVYRQGVHILPELSGFETPEAMFDAVYGETRKVFEKYPNHLLTTFGGEHSISIPIIKAFYERYQDLTVLQIDAHTDLRPEYEGTAFNHACAVYDASLHTNLIQVGIRSMDIGEMDHLDAEKCYFMHDMVARGDAWWMDHSIGQMTSDVYITLDLDAFDPSIMPGTGTPEPGGMLWYQMITYLKKVFAQRNVVGFDIVELAPIEGHTASQFLAAKLYYKMLTYHMIGS